MVICIDQHTELTTAEEREEEKALQERKKDTRSKLAHKHGRRYVGSFGVELSLLALFYKFFLFLRGGFFSKNPAR